MEDIQNNEFIDLNELLNAIWIQKFLIMLITSFFIITSVLYALILPNIYKSEALLMPKESNPNGINGMFNQYAGIASIAGISIPSSNNSKSNEALSRIHSYDFFLNHFLPNIRLEDLVASKKWDQENNELIYDKAIYNKETQAWVREVKPPLNKIPSSQEAYKVYKDILKTSKDSISSFVKLSIEHHSPYVAKDWVNLIINKIDQSMKNEDRVQAEKSIEYLNKVTSTTSFEDIKRALSNLTEEQMKLLMIMESSESYIFTILDPPIAPEEKFKPSRALIVIISTLFGVFFGTTCSLVYYFSDKKIHKR